MNNRATHRVSMKTDAGDIGWVFWGTEEFCQQCASSIVGCPVRDQDGNEIAKVVEAHVERADA